MTVMQIFRFLWLSCFLASAAFCGSEVVDFKEICPELMQFGDGALKGNYLTKYVDKDVRLRNPYEMAFVPDYNDDSSGALICNNVISAAAAQTFYIGDGTRTNATLIVLNNLTCDTLNCGTGKESKSMVTARNMDLFTLKVGFDEKNIVTVFIADTLNVMSNPSKPNEGGKVDLNADAEIICKKFMASQSINFVGSVGKIYAIESEVEARNRIITGAEAESKYERMKDIVAIDAADITTGEHITKTIREIYFPEAPEEQDPNYIPELQTSTFDATIPYKTLANPDNTCDASVSDNECVLYGYIGGVLTVNDSTYETALCKFSEIISAMQSTVSGLEGTNGTIRLTKEGGEVIDGGLTIDNDQDYTFSGAVSGEGYLSKSGSGKQAILGTHTYTGPTIIDEGILKGHFPSTSNILINSVGTYELSESATVQNIDPTSTGSVSVAEHILTLNAGNYPDFKVGGEGGLVKTGPGTLTLQSSATGTTIIQGGILISDVSGDLVLDDGEFQLPSDVTVTGLDGVVGTLVTLGDYILAVNGGGNYDGNITGTGGLTKSGPGILTLTDTNYDGLTTIHDGVLISNVTGDLMLTGGEYRMPADVTLTGLDGSGGLVTLGDHILTINGGGNYDGDIAGEGRTLVKTGAETQTLAGNVVADMLDLQNGILSIGEREGEATAFQVNTIQFSQTGGQLQIARSYVEADIEVAAPGRIDIQKDSVWYGNIALQNPLEVQTDATHTWKDSTLTGNSSITKNGPGEWIWESIQAKNSSPQIACDAGTLTLKSETVLSDTTQLSVAANAKTVFMGHQTLNKISGPGAIYIEHHMLRLLVTEDIHISTAIHASEGTLLLRSASPHNVTLNAGALAPFSGTLKSTKNIHAIIAQGDWAGNAVALTAAEGSKITLKNPAVVHAIKGDGTIHAEAKLTLQQKYSETFDGDITGNQLLEVTSSSIWSCTRALSHQGGLTIGEKATVKLSEPCNPLEPLHVAGKLRALAAQTLNLQSLTGMLWMGTNTLTIPLDRDRTLQGDIKSFGDVVIHGANTLRIQSNWPQFVGRLDIQSGTVIAEQPLSASLQIQNAGSLTLPDNSVCQHLQNTGTVTCSGDLTLTHGESENSGTLNVASLTLSETGVLKSSGNIQNLNWFGHLHIGTENLTIENAIIQPGAQLWVKVDETANGRVTFTNSPANLADLTIILTPKNAPLSAKTITLFTLPSASIPQLPVISTQYGLGAFFQDPPLQLTQSDRTITLSLPDYMPAQYQ